MYVMQTDQYSLVLAFSSRIVVCGVTRNPRHCESSYTALALCKNTQQKYGPDLKQTNKKNPEQTKIQKKLCIRGMYTVESTRMQCGNKIVLML